MYVIANYTKNDIPLDTMWSDIDYLYNYRDFTYDPVRYDNLMHLISGLHNENRHYVPILDAGVAIREEYPAYAEGVE